MLGLVLSIFAVSLLESPVDWETPGPGGSHVIATDKLAHLATYFMLTVLIAYALIEKQGAWRLPVAFLLANGIGALIELVQATLPHRNAETGDILANLIGAGLAWLLWWILLATHQRARERPGS